MRKLTVLTVILTLFLVACQTATPNANNATPMNNTSVFDDVNFTEDENNQSSVPVESLDAEVDYRITAVEGDIVRVPLTATDPDGDTIEYSYEDPFNAQGVWETEIGDEGEYIVTVTADDGQATTQEQILVEIQRANRAPVLDCPETFSFQEGELAALNCDVYDPEGSQVVVTYSGWMRSRTYMTDFNDAGTHTVLIRASDGAKTTEKEVTVEIQNTNRAPTVEPIEDVTVRETSTASVAPVVSDPDGDEVTTTYSQPLNDDGNWETTYGDAGTYTATVTVRDGDLSTRESFEITVTERNQPPVIRDIETIEVEEGETVRIQPQAYDPDGDTVTLRYSGWMNSSTYTTTYEDAYTEGCNTKGCTATYTVFVTADDGESTSRQEVTVEVTDRNRPPVFQG